MAYVVFPSNDTSRIGFLIAASQRHRKIPEGETKHISDEIVARVNTLLPPYQTALSDLNSSEAVRSSEIDQKNLAFIALEVYLRDLWTVHKRRVTREQLPNKVLTYYGLPENGIIPRFTGKHHILATAQMVVNGDAAAVAAGYPAAVNPSASELAEKIAQVLNEMGDVGVADAEVNTAQEILADFRSTANELIDDIIAELEYKLRKLPAPDKRRIMRSYGVTFSSSSGSVVEE